MKTNYNNKKKKIFKQTQNIENAEIYIKIILYLFNFNSIKCIIKQTRNINEQFSELMK